MSSFMDTGLGWGAWDTSLMSVSGLMGNISGLSGEGFTGQPLPKNLETAADVVAAGFHMSSVAANNREYYIACTGEEDVLCFYYPLPNNPARHYMVLVTNTSGATVRRVEYNTTTGSVQTTNTVRITTQDATTGLYYYQQNWGEAFSGDGVWYVPMFSTRDAGLAAIQYVDRAFYKVNAGYACCAFARWIDIGGNVVTAPTIISSDPNFAVIGSSDTVPDPEQTTFGVRHQGMSFTVALVAGLAGAVTAAVVPFADFTAAFPRPISAATLAEALITYHNIRVLNAPDPYGGDAEPGGGEGNPDEDEEIDFSTPPTVGSYVGFFRMWNPTEAELRQLASWMWSSAFDLDTFKRIFSAPIDAILGLSLVPVQPAGIGGYTIVLGGIDTQISAFTVTNRYVTLDCGSLTVDERWGAYLDYSPFTKMSIFLPYIGFRDISTDDVMGKTVALQYNVDVLSGACVAELKCGGSVLYSWQGNCAQQLPITSADWSNALSAALGLAGTAAAAIVTGGGSLPLAGTVASATVNALSLKPRMERGGSISGAAGAMAGQVPYLVRERPEQAVPGRQNHFIGYPSFTTVTLGSIAGYTEVESIHLEGIPATAAELSELESILKEGFIL